MVAASKVKPFDDRSFVRSTLDLFNPEPNAVPVVRKSSPTRLNLPGASEFPSRESSELV